ncbi:hypothetical protein GCM10009525_16510 [Streptosporangium amethystogenes subsp. fukuiense]
MNVPPTSTPIEWLNGSPRLIVRRSGQVARRDAGTGSAPARPRRAGYFPSKRLSMGSPGPRPGDRLARVPVALALRSSRVFEFAGPPPAYRRSLLGRMGSNESFIPFIAY